MRPTSFQQPELRDSSDTIVQAGAYGKNSPFVNAQNTGAFDYINNNLMALQNGKLNSSDLAGQFDTQLKTKGIQKLDLANINNRANGNPWQVIKDNFANMTADTIYIGKIVNGGTYCYWGRKHTATYGNFVIQYYGTWTLRVVTCSNGTWTQYAITTTSQGTFE